jgi:type IV pilus assembly protein PilM
VFSARKVKPADVAIALSGHSVIIKKISIPATSEEELAEVIPWEAEQYIPFDVEDVNLAYQVLTGGGGDGNMDVLLVAAKKDKIHDYTSVVTQAGRNPVLVDVDVFALQNCYEMNYDPDPSQTVALLNVGASVMNINIVRGGIPLFTRDVSVGGNQYTDALQKELDLSYEDAERLKKGEAIAGVSSEHRDTILRSVSDILILEIQKTFDFFRATASGENIQRIYIAGGTARVPGLVDLLREEFALPIEELYPFRKIIINPGRQSEDQVRELAPRLAIAVGLALRSFDTP